MNDKDRADDANMNTDEPSMLASLMTAAAAYAVQRDVPLNRVAEAAGLAPHDLIAAPERVPEDAVRLPGPVVRERVTTLHVEPVQIRG